MTHSAKFVALKILWLAATEAALIYEVREILLHHLFNHLAGLVQAFFGGASDAEVKRRVLDDRVSWIIENGLMVYLQQLWPCSCQGSILLGL